MDITADKLNSLIQAAKVPEVEPIWAQLFAKALEGKDVKDLLMNVGSGGGAAAAPAAGGAAAAGGDAAADAPKEEAKEEGGLNNTLGIIKDDLLTVVSANREGGVRRGHGLRSFRLSDFCGEYSSSSTPRKTSRGQDRDGIAGHGRQVSHSRCCFSLATLPMPHGLLLITCPVPLAIADKG